MNAIPCLTWVKRGVMSGRPQRVKLTDEDLLKLMKEKDSHNNHESDDDLENSDSGSSNDEIAKKYDLNVYDSDDAEGSNANGLGGLLFHSGNDEQFMTPGDEESDDEAEIQADDNMIALGKVTGDIFGLESYVYNENSSSLYCHHDTILESFPLAMEWVGYDPGEDAPGNLLAIGSIEPHIELWDLDIMDTLEPAFVLYGAQKKKGKKKVKTSGKGHTDAILDLSWNSLQNNALASASADFTIGLWDIEDGEMVMSLADHTDKVQALKWHPFEPHTLLSGSFDHTAKVFDCRHTDASHKSWSLPGEVERVTWNVHDPFCFLASTDTGHLYYVDVRSEKPVFTLQAHNSAITGLSVSSELRGCVVTSSSDKLIKVWDIRDNKPDLVCSKNLKLGEIHCMEACPDSGFIYAVGGPSELRIFHLKTSDEVLTRWDLEVPEDRNTKSKASDDESDQSDTSMSSDDDDDNDDNYIKSYGALLTTKNNIPKLKEAVVDQGDSSDDVEVPIVKKPKKSKKKSDKKKHALLEKSFIKTSEHSINKKKKKKMTEKTKLKEMGNIDKSNPVNLKSSKKKKKHKVTKE